MENNNQASNELFDFGFNFQSRDILRSLGKWAKITAIAAFTSTAISLIIQFAIPPKTVDGLGNAGNFMQVATGASLTMAVISAIIGVIINLFLYRFSSEVTEAVNTNDQSKIESAFNNLRTYFLIIGILLIIVLVFVVFAILFGIILGAAGAVGR